MIGVLAVLFGVFVIASGVIEITTKDDCKVIKGDILGNVECDEIQVLEKKS